MTTQTNSNPFENSAQQTGAIATGEEFIIRTMHDDINGSASKVESDAESFKARSGFPTNTVTQAKSPFDSNSARTEHSEVNPDMVEQKIIPKIVETPSTPLQDNAYSNNATFHKIIFSIIVLIIILIITLGYLYFTKTTKKTSIDENQTPITDTESTKPIDQVTMTPATEKYSSEKPNLLMLDFSSSADDINTQLIRLSEEIKNISSLSSIYEFVLVDKDNNPIDFKIFAENVKLNLGTNISNKLDKSFSLFFYNDNGNIRLGVEIKTIPNSKTTLLTEMNKKEKTLANDISPVFLNYPIDNNQKTFVTSVYNTNENVIRYLNLNSEKNLSIDYTVTDNYLIIGTSKDTLRKILKNIPDANPSDQNNNASSSASTNQTAANVNNNPTTQTN